MAAAQRDYYEILGVARDADAKAIKDAFRELALKYHPDRNKSPEAEARFKEIAEAYAVLSDPKKRAEYDARGFSAVEGFTPEDLFGGIDFGDIFGDLGFGLDFGLGAGGCSTACSATGADLRAGRTCRWSSPSRSRRFCTAASGRCATRGPRSAAAAGEAAPNRERRRAPARPAAARARR